MKQRHRALEETEGARGPKQFIYLLVFSVSLRLRGAKVFVFWLRHSDSTSTAPSSQTLALLSCWSCMSCARTYVRKTLPMAPPALAEIADSPSVETSSGAPIVGASESCGPPFDRPLRNVIPIRNVLGKRISRDWRSFSRCRGLRAFLYVPEICSSLLAERFGSATKCSSVPVSATDFSLLFNDMSG